MAKESLDQIIFNLRASGVREDWLEEIERAAKALVSLREIMAWADPWSIPGNTSEMASYRRAEEIIGIDS
jgi:hypothetical protein